MKVEQYEKAAALEPSPKPAVVLITTADSGFGLCALDALVRLHEGGKVRFLGVIDSAGPAYASLKARGRRLGLRLLRGRFSSPSVASECDRLGLDIFIPPRNDLNHPEVGRYLDQSRANLAILFGCDQILRPSLLKSGPRFINYHNSHLPDYRGVGATAWPLLERARESGFTFHTIEDESIDQGLLVHQDKISLRAEMSSEELGTILNRRAAAAIPTVIELLQAETKFPRLPEGGAYYTRKKFDSARTLCLDEDPAEIAHKARVFGHVEMRWGKVRLRLQDIAAEGPERKGIGRLSLRLPLRDGAIHIGRVNYLPALAVAPLLWAARYRYRRRAAAKG